MARYILNDVTLEIPKTLATPTIHYALQLGYYEQNEATELQYLISEGDIVMEIGAGIGYIGILLAKDPRVKQVYCYEANPELIEVIQNNHKLNFCNVSIYNCILSRDDTGYIDFYICDDFWGSSTNARGRKVQVAKKSFQAEIARLKPTLLVLDIEGGELDIFDDINLLTVKRIMMEIHQGVIGRAGVKKVFDTLSGKGFHYDQYHSSKSIVTFTHIDA